MCVMCVWPKRTNAPQPDSLAGWQSTGCAGLNSAAGNKLPMRRKKRSTTRARHVAAFSYCNLTNTGSDQRSHKHPEIEGWSSKFVGEFRQTVLQEQGELLSATLCPSKETRFSVEPNRRHPCSFSRFPDIPALMKKNAVDGWMLTAQQHPSTRLQNQKPQPLRKRKSVPASMGCPFDPDRTSCVGPPCCTAISKNCSKPAAVKFSGST